MTRDTLSFWTQAYIHEKRGAVALLMIALIFFALAFMGMAMDYGNYVMASQEIKSVADRSVLKGSTQCIHSMLQNIHKNVESWGIASESEILEKVKKIMEDGVREGEKYAKEEFEYAQKELSASISFKPNSFSISGRASSLPTHANENQDYCIIEIRYTGAVSTLIGHLFGWFSFPLGGQSIAGATFNGFDKPAAPRIIE